jgi:hypothetical protein
MEGSHTLPPISDVVFVCPHCGGSFVVEALNCGIFRHGEMSNGQPLPPHASKDECKRLLANGRGCGKPFRMLFVC